MKPEQRFGVFTDEACRNRFACVAFEPTIRRDGNRQIPANVGERHEFQLV